MGSAVVVQRIAPRQPVVSHQAHLEVEGTGIEGLALVLAGAAHDQLELAAVARRATHVRQAGFEFFGSAVRHARRG